MYGKDLQINMRIADEPLVLLPTQNRPKSASFRSLPAIPLDDPENIKLMSEDDLDGLRPRIVRSQATQTSNLNLANLRKPTASIGSAIKHQLSLLDCANPCADFIRNFATSLILLLSVLIMIVSNDHEDLIQLIYDPVLAIVSVIILIITLYPSSKYPFGNATMLIQCRYMAHKLIPLYFSLTLCEFSESHRYDPSPGSAS